MVIDHNPLLPRTTSERENVEVTIKAAQAILTISIIIIPITSILLNFVNLYKAISWNILYIDMQFLFYTIPEREAVVGMLISTNIPLLFLILLLFQCH